MIGPYTIGRDAFPGSNDVPVSRSRAMLHTVLHGLVLLLAFRVFKWTWTRTGSKSDGAILDSNTTKREAENRNREHGGQSLKPSLCWDG